MTVKYIILHWTAGNYKPCQTDLNSYQLLIDDTGKHYIGKPVGKTCSTGGMNSITYNIACCGGLDRTPITKVQIEALFKATADKCKEYGLKPDKVYTHAVIGDMCKKGTITMLLPNNKWLYQNIGKIDLTKTPYITGTATETNNYIRKKINWYYLLKIFS